MVQVVGTHNEDAGVVVEPGPDCEDAGLDHALVDLHGGRRCVGVVDAPLVRWRPQPHGRIVIFGHLEVVDVNMDGMLVVVVIDEPPFLHRIEFGLDQRRAREVCIVPEADFIRRSELHVDCIAMQSPSLQ